MEWWDDLWLNEGFATIMGMKAADYAENSTSRTVHADSMFNQNPCFSESTLL